MNNKKFFDDFVDSMNSSDDLGFMEYRLLIALLRHADSYGACSPSRETLAKEARLAESRVSNLTSLLSKKGFINKKVERKYAAKVRYQLLIKKPINEQADLNGNDDAIGNDYVIGNDDLIGNDTDEVTLVSNVTSGVTQEYDPAFDEEIDFDAPPETEEQKIERERRESEQAEQEYWASMPDIVKNTGVNPEGTPEPPFSLDQYPGWQAVWGADKEGVSAAHEAIRQALKTWYRDPIQRAVRATANKYPKPTNPRSYFFGILKRELKRGQVSL